MDANSLAVFGSIIVIIAVFASLVATAVKRAVPKVYHDFVPLGLVILLLPGCSLLAWLLGHGWQLGLGVGVLATAGAVFGWSFVVKTLKGIQSVRDAAGNG